MERQYIMVFLELLPLMRICSINQLKQVSYSVLSFFTISRNMLGLSVDLNITSMLSFPLIANVPLYHLSLSMLMSQLKP
jgi:hypothetical protein